MTLRDIKALMVVAILPLMIFAQDGTIAGRVTDAESGDALIGANVVVDGTNMGAATDASGDYTINNVPAGSYTLTASVIGYDDASGNATVSAGGTVTVNLSLTAGAIMLSSLEVLASRATRATPVAYSNISKADIENRLGSQDIPMILNTTPSVYATLQGGGAGDARMNVRGFSQRNVAVMINGVPVNDMENGWVYWSNWDGVADATSSIQLQRGLSAVNLAAPSIGGSMNIITDPTSRTRGGRFKQELGAGTFLKTTINLNSGMIADKLALSATIVRKTGNGVIDKTWTDGWAYYFGASYALNKNNLFEFYALGAPQRHGQMRYAQNIASYSKELGDRIFSAELLALDVLGAKDDAGNDIPDGLADIYNTFSPATNDRYDDAGFEGKYGDAESGRFYNENWNAVSPSYTGQQYYYMYGDKTVDRHDPNFLNESENYYHKPQVNLNWFTTLNEKMRLSTVFYYSGGSGGGTGTFSDMLWDYNGPSRIVNWDGTIAINEGTANRRGNDKPAGESVGFLRNSINRQWTFGAISKFYLDLSASTKLEFGLDWRTAEIEHTREVRDLLGGTYAVNMRYDNRATVVADRYTSFYNEFDASIADATVKLGENINYKNTNSVDWIGFFLQGEHQTGALTAYAMGGYSQIKYGLIDFFKKADNWMFEQDASGVNTSVVREGFGSGDGGVLTIDADWIGAVQFKGGGLFRLSDNLDVFGNFGVVQKVPILDNVIDDIAIALAPDPTNEVYISTEAGANAWLMNRLMVIKVNLYNTMWKDRNLVRAVSTGQGSSGDTDLVFLTGVDQTHNGLEVELTYQPMSMLRLDLALGLGDWSYSDDAEGVYKSNTQDTTYTSSYALKDLKVGDQPQTQISVSANLFPIKGLRLRGTYNYYMRHSARWGVASREYDPSIADDADRAPSWEVPNYGRLDLHLNYVLPIALGGTQLTLFAHIFNALDGLDVQDAVDNSAFNAFWGDDSGQEHKANDAEVYLTPPRYFNVGLSVGF